MEKNYFSLSNATPWKEIADKLKTEQPPRPVSIDEGQDYNLELAELAQAQQHGQLALDIYQTSSDLIVEAPIAGVKPEDLDITINNDVLTIKGTRTRSKKVEAKNIIYQECHWGAFSRSVILPVDVVSDRIDASLKDGVLTIRLPKARPNRSIKVKVGK